MDVIISDPFFTWLLLGIGVALIFLEVFIPSGGIIGIVALAALGLGIYSFFHQGKILLGSMTGIGVAVFVISMFSFMLRRRPRIRMPSPRPTIASAKSWEGPA